MHDALDHDPTRPACRQCGAPASYVLAPERPILRDAVARTGDRYACEPCHAAMLARVDDDAERDGTPVQVAYRRNLAAVLRREWVRIVDAPVSVAS